MQVTSDRGSQNLTLAAARADLPDPDQKERDGNAERRIGAQTIERKPWNPAGQAEGNPPARSDRYTKKNEQHVAVAFVL
jgi:hypothetical protein